jgi:hypothetical protein
MAEILRIVLRPKTRLEVLHDTKGVLEGRCRLRKAFAAMETAPGSGNSNGVLTQASKTPRAKPLQQKEPRLWVLGSWRTLAKGEAFPLFSR